MLLKEKITNTHRRYRSALASGGKASKKTKHHKQELVDLLVWGENSDSSNLVLDYANSHGRPITLAEIGRLAFPNRSPTYIYDLFDSQRDLLVTLYDVLRVSGAWELYDGETLKYETQGGRRMTVSTRLPVVFSNDDVSWIPRLRDPDSTTTELSAIFLSSSTPLAQQKRGIVDHIIIEKQPQERVYVERHMKPLLSHEFNVPIEFFESPDKRRVTRFGEVKKPHLQIASQMVGTYFQNVAGIFDAQGGKVVKRLPQVTNRTQKRALLRAMVDNAADLSSPYEIRFIGSQELLDLTRECASTLNFDASMSPILNKNYKLTPLARDKNILIASATNHAPRGRNVLAKTEDGVVVIGRVMGEDELSGNMILELYDNPRKAWELYQEFSYRLSIRGGRDSVRNFIGMVKPGNPFALLSYLRAAGYKIPEINPVSPQNDFQEFVYDEWRGLDLTGLVEVLRREGRNYVEAPKA